MQSWISRTGYFVNDIIHHTKSTKTRRKHEKEKDKFSGIHVVPIPRPLARQSLAQLRSAAFSVHPANQRNSRKGGDRGGWMGYFHSPILERVRLGVET